MPDVVLGRAALEQVRAAVAGEARRVPALADPVTAPPATTFGGLVSSEAMTAALGAFVVALGGDLGEAGSRLDQVDRALDTTMSALETADRGAAPAVARV